MRFRNGKNSSGLFLMEMILCLLFFALACSICIRFFYAGYKDRHEARALNHFQELTITSFELLESWSGSAGDYAEGLRPDYNPVLQTEEPEQKPEDFSGMSFTGCVLLYFDRSWNSCPAEESIWQMQVRLYTGGYQKGAVAVFYEGSLDSSPVYQNRVRYPVGETA